MDIENKSIIFLLKIRDVIIWFVNVHMNFVINVVENIDILIANARYSIGPHEFLMIIFYIYYIFNINRKCRKILGETFITKRIYLPR